MSVPPVSTRQVPSVSASTSTPPASSGSGAPAQNASVTCARDGRSHVVPHAVLAESLTAGTGCCTAVCGHVVLPASLASPPGDRCALCTDATGTTRRAPRRRLWSGGHRPRAAP